MKLAKTSIFTAVATIIKIITSLIINKMIAYYVGPTGLAYVGNFQNFIAMTTSFSNGGITQGIVKYISETKSVNKKKILIDTSLKISILCSFCVAVLVAFFQKEISIYIFDSKDYSGLIFVFALTVILFSLNSVLLAVLNGNSEIKKFISCNIFSSVSMLFITAILIVTLGLIGALYALAINQSIVFFIALYFFQKTELFFKLNFFSFKFKLSKLYRSKLFKYSLMTLTTALITPLLLINIRSSIENQLSIEYSGYWQGMWYISSTYLMVITTSLSIYFLPKFSSLKNAADIKAELIKGYTFIVPVAVFFAIIIYSLRWFIIEIAFTPEFHNMEVLFLGQLIADVIKVSSWLLSYLVLAKTMAKLYIFSEILFATLLYINVNFMLELYGFVGVSYAFILNYSLYFVFLYISMRKKYGL